MEYITIIENVCSLNEEIYNDLRQLLYNDIEEIKDIYNINKKDIKYENIF